MNLARHRLEHDLLGFPTSPQGGNPFGKSLEAAGVTTGNTGAANLAAIQTVLSGGGLLSLTQPGTYTVSGVIALPDDTELYLGTGVTLQRGASNAQPLIQNKNAGYMLVGTQFSRSASATVIVAETNHKHQTGDKVEIRALGVAAYNGAFVVTKINATQWSYVSGASATDNGGSEYAHIIPVRATIAAASVSRTSNVVTVTEANHGKRIGMQVWVSSTDRTTDASWIGIKTVKYVTTTSWQYDATGADGNPTGDILLSWNKNITLRGGGVVDGTRATNSAQVTRFGMVNNLVIEGLALGGSGLRCAQVDNGHSVFLRDLTFFDTLVGVQFEGGGTDIFIERIKGAAEFIDAGAGSMDDFIAFTGVDYATSTFYKGVASPYGLQAFDNLLVDNVRPEQCNAAVKYVAHVGAPLKRGVFRNLKCLNLNANTTANSSKGVFIQRETDTGLVGGAVENLVIDGIEWGFTKTPANGNAVIVANEAFNGNIVIRNLKFNPLCTTQIVLDQDASGGTRHVMIDQVNMTAVEGNGGATTILCSLSNIGLYGCVEFARSCLIIGGTGDRIFNTASGTGLACLKVTDCTYYKAGTNGQGTMFTIGNGTTNFELVVNGFTTADPTVTNGNGPQNFFNLEKSGGTNRMYVSNMLADLGKIAFDNAANIGAAAWQIRLLNVALRSPLDYIINFAGHASTNATIDVFADETCDFGTNPLRSIRFTPAAGATAFRVNAPTLPVDLSVAGTLTKLTGARQVDGDRVFTTGISGTVVANRTVTWSASALKWWHPLNPATPTFAVH